MYIITFMDDYTNYCYVYLMKSKEETIKKFIIYKQENENQPNKKIKLLRSDDSG